MNAVPLTPAESVATIANEVTMLVRLGVSHQRASIEIGRRYGVSPNTITRLTLPYVVHIESSSCLDVAA